MVKKHTAALIPSLTLHKIEQIIKGLVTILLKKRVCLPTQFKLFLYIVFCNGVWIMKKRTKEQIETWVFLKQSTHL